MKRTKILLDLRNLNNPTSGFGQIAVNYAKHFNRLKLDDIQFVLLVPEHYEGDLSGNAEIVRYTKEMKHHPALLPEVDLWHSVNQQQKVRKIDNGTKFVLTIHDLNYLTEKNWIRQWKHNFILRRLIHRADAITTISGFVANQVENLFREALGNKKVNVVYDAVERICQNPQSRPSFADNKPFFFTIGQIRKKKNFHLLVEVMREFPEYNLYICGDDHFEGAKLIRKKIQETRVTNVKLTGKISEDEKVWLYHNCQAFLFPSQGEGFGLPVIEAMQFGKPVFVSSYTCLPEISGGHAFVWNDLNTETMVNGIKQYLSAFYNDKQQIEQTCEYAFSFGYEEHVRRYVELYRQILHS